MDKKGWERKRESSGDWPKWRTWQKSRLFPWTSSTKHNSVAALLCPWMPVDLAGKLSHCLLMVLQQTSKNPLWSKRHFPRYHSKRDVCKTIDRTNWKNLNYCSLDYAFLNHKYSIFARPSQRVCRTVSPLFNLDRTQLRWFRHPIESVLPSGGVMGMATCEGTPGLTKDLLEGIYLTAGLGTPWDPTVGGICPAEACLLYLATLNSTSG